jgi:tetratricopeptide (TPR) repeat protein
VSGISSKINKIRNWQASIVIAVLGLASYFTGLRSPFWDDDYRQIVNNVPVHSISNFLLFFKGGTFYNGQGLAPLGGYYYRPLMTTIFSVIYSIFGPHTFAFHLFQLLLCIGSAILLYLVFRYFFSALLALVMAIVFLVHPLNSQVAFAIPYTQDALFFFFGILAFWLLLRFKSVKSLVLVSLSLFLSMLSKETAIVFIAVSILYVFWFNRKRFYAFVGILVPPIALYLILSIHAVGFSRHANVAPIDKLNLASRLFTAPSIMLFYIYKFLLPWKLATAYYWVYPNFSSRYVLLPLIIDLAAIALVVYAAFRIRKKASKDQFHGFIFFAIWAGLGMLTFFQIIPLDMTASDVYFYFSMAGILGMIGITLSVYQARINLKLFLVICVLVIVALGFRTAMRGVDWHNTTSLAYQDISVSPDDYLAYQTIAADLANQGKYAKADAYISRSVSIYPTFSNYYSEGLVLTYLHNYSGAVSAYENALKYGVNQDIYENLAELTLVTNSPNLDGQIFTTALHYFPHDSKIWLCLAIVEQGYGDNAKAKVYLQTAENYGQAPQSVITAITDNQRSTIRLTNLNVNINY